jgi:fused signal recognition particle receptor
MNSLSLLPLLASQQPTPEDIAGVAVLGAFALAFVALGWAYLRKKKKERIEALTRGSEEADREHDLQDYVDGKKKPAELPEATESEVTEVPKADDVAEAEKAAIKAKAAEERARRERERLEKEAEAAARAAEDAHDAAAEKLEASEAKAEVAEEEAIAEAAAEEAAEAAARAESQEESEAEAKAREAQEKLEAAKQAEAEAVAAADEAKERAKQLRSALSKTRDGFLGKITSALSGASEVDDDVMDELEAALFTADLGPRTADRLLEAVKEKLAAKELSDPAKVTAVIKDEVVSILTGMKSAPLDVDREGPTVIMILGVNGAGKTTSIGKLAKQLKDGGKSVLMGAGDTFRAAAAEQLAVWAERNDAPIVMSDKDGADPSSVLFDAVKQAKEDGIDVVLCDTAGRLHTKVNLMEELEKVRRVLAKAADGAPHEALLVLDGTVGQNAIQQAKQFGEAVPLTGIILTKLDGTAKGGVIIGIADELGIPVRFIGVGEKVDDLRPFDAEQFVEALFDDGSAQRSAA